MFAVELIAVMCLSANPDTCTYPLIPSPERLTFEQCEAQAEQRAAAWRTERPGLEFKLFACQPVTELEAIDVVEVADGIWVHKGVSQEVTPDNLGDIANIGFVIGSDAVAVIDAGGSRSVAEGLYVAIRQRTNLPIRHLVLTHMHPDHTLGAEVFVEAGADVTGNAHLADALDRRAQTYVRNFSRLLAQPEAFIPKVVVPHTGVADSARIDLGGRVLHLQSWPTAHTNNDLTVLDDATGTLFSGDLVFVELTPVVDGSLLGWLDVLAQMKGIAAQRLVPGHGPVMQAWPEGMQDVVAYLEALRDQTRAAVKDGLSLSAAIAVIGLDQRGAWMNFDTNNPRNATVAYTELEWE